MTEPRRSAYDWMLLTQLFCEEGKLFSVWERLNPGCTAVWVRPGMPTKFNPEYSRWLEGLAEECMRHREEIQVVLEETMRNREEIQGVVDNLEHCANPACKCGGTCAANWDEDDDARR